MYEKVDLFAELRQHSEEVNVHWKSPYNVLNSSVYSINRFLAWLMSFKDICSLFSRNTAVNNLKK